MTNFKVGDRVRILRKALSYERGWQNSWAESMDRCVGKIGTIVFINHPSTRYDIEVKLPRTCCIWGFPSFVLKLAPKKKRAKK